MLSDKDSTCSAGATGDMGSIPGSGRSPGGGCGSLIQYSCLENPMNRGAWRATVHGIAKSHTRLKKFTSHETGGLPFLSVRSFDSMFQLIKLKTGFPCTFTELSPLVSLRHGLFSVCTRGSVFTQL